jgi:hypothetical protein
VFLHTLSVDHKQFQHLLLLVFAKRVILLYTLAEGSVVKNKLLPLDDDLISAYNDAIHSYDEVSYPAEGDNMEEAILLLRADKTL